MDTILQFEHVNFSYADGGKKLDILKNLSISFVKGTFYSIIGPSGCGKTTTLALAGALDMPQSGKVLFKGKDIRKIGLANFRKRNAAMIFQSYNLISYMTALENVMMAMEISHSYKGRRKEKALELLTALGISEEEGKRNVLKLSGGQQQRIAIARALATDAELILADEPTGNLDIKTAGEIIQILGDLAHKMGKCVIVVSHSSEVAKASDVEYRFTDKGMELA